VVTCAPSWLRPGGHLVVETSVRQAPVLGAAYRAAGLTARVSRDEDREGTAVVGRLDRV
jgi:release factor glutamine methyltransferase